MCLAAQSRSLHGVCALFGGTLSWSVWLAGEPRSSLFSTSEVDAVRRFALVWLADISIARPKSEAVLLQNMSKHGV